MSIRAAFAKLPDLTSDIRRMFDRSVLSATSTLDFPAINAGASADLTLAVNGAEINDTVILGLPASPTAGLVFDVFVSAANVVTIRATNITGSAVNVASAMYKILILKP